MANSNSDFSLPGYHRVRMLGTGAKSTIWEVRNFETGSTYALKRVIINSKDDHRYIEQAENEHEISRQIPHPSVRRSFAIRKIQRFFSIKEIHLLMEYCPGQSVKENLPDSLPEICNIFAQVASIMEYINKAGFVHADMKPGNIIIDDSGKVMVIDFGQSCKVGTIKERIQGTPDFMAPEQINRWPLDYRTDVFNFGASLYWAITGTPPPPQLFLQGSLRINERNTIKPPSKINPEIPQALDMLLLHCLKLQPADRIGHMKDVAIRLGRIMMDDLKIRPKK